jgi:hypothetical protein
LEQVLKDLMVVQEHFARLKEIKTQEAAEVEWVELVVHQLKFLMVAFLLELQEMEGSDYLHFHLGLQLHQQE